MRSQFLLTSGSVCSAVGLMALGAATTPVFGGANLLVNPGFEAPLILPPAVNSECAGWTFELDCQRAPFQQSHPSHPDPGSEYGIWAKTFQPAGGGIFQNVGNISAGATYNFNSIWFIEPGFRTIDPLDQVSALMRLTFLDAGNNQVGTPTIFEKTPSTTSEAETNTWLPFGLSAVAPAGATQARVFFGWINGGPGMGSQSVLFDNASLEGPGVPPVNSTWIINGSGNWNLAGNWANGVVPDAVNATAEFFGAITGPATVFTNEGVIVGTMNFNNANTYVITGAGSLAMQVTTGNANIIVQQGLQKINLPLHLNSNTTANVSGGATLLIADPLILNGNTLTKTGPGTMLIEAPVRSSAAALINVNGGDTRVNFGMGSPATASTAADGQVTLRVTNGRAILGANQTLRGLDSVTTNAGDQELNLSGNIVRVYPADRNAEELSIYNDIRAARNSASGRDGIFDSTAASTDFSVGVTDQATDAHGDLHVLVRLTRNGDANVDGTVTLQDFNRLATFFGQSNMRWDNGDFNYDGTVNLQDFNRLAANFGMSAGPDGPTPEDWAALGSAVPEPTTATLVVAGMLAAARRRRRVG